MVHFSENDGLRRLEAQRMLFKLQITKTLLMPSSDSIVVLLEQPDLDYIDPNKEAYNVIGLVSRSTMRAKALFQLQRAEIANCAYSVEFNKRKWIMIGTTFLKPEEQIPSSGRFILLDPENFDVLQEYEVAGSLQSILTTNDNKYLILGVNNQIEVYDFTSVLPTFRND